MKKTRVSYPVTSDDEWFAKNPERTFRMRVMTPDEMRGHREHNQRAWPDYDDREHRCDPELQDEEGTIFFMLVHREADGTLGGASDLCDEEDMARIWAQIQRELDEQDALDYEPDDLHEPSHRVHH